MAYYDQYRTKFPSTVRPPGYDIFTNTYSRPPVGPAPYHAGGFNIHNPFPAQNAGLPFGAPITPLTYQGPSYRPSVPSAPLAPVPSLPSDFEDQFGRPGIPGGGYGLFKDLLGSYKSATDEAGKANETRYNEILRGYNEREGGLLGQLQGLGLREQADIRDQYRDLAAAQAANLQDRGLAGTTIAPTLQAGVAKEESSALGRLNERLRRERLGLEEGLSGERLRFMERRDDVYPNVDRLLDLALKFGQAGFPGGEGLEVPSAPTVPGRPVASMRPGVPTTRPGVGVPVPVTPPQLGTTPTPGAAYTPRPSVGSRGLYQPFSPIRRLRYAQSYAR